MASSVPWVSTGSRQKSSFTAFWCGHGGGSPSSSTSPKSSIWGLEPAGRARNTGDPPASNSLGTWQTPNLAVLQAWQSAPTFILLIQCKTWRLLGEDSPDSLPQSGFCKSLRMIKAFGTFAQRVHMLLENQIQPLKINQNLFLETSK